jgi:hypothetical protein
MRIKKIDGYDGYYVTSDGRILSSGYIYNQFGRTKHKRKWLKQRTQNSGYLVCDLYKDKKKKTFTVHRLVAIAFLEKIDNKNNVNHINSIKTDNNLKNLEWVSHSENTIHMFKNNNGSTMTDKGRIKLSLAKRGKTVSEESRKKMSLSKIKITKEIAFEIREQYNNGNITKAALTRKFNISIYTVEKAIKNKLIAFNLDEMQRKE